jgi:hypothetical protein
MKPKPSAHDRSFMPLILWRDDLESIAAILTANGGQVEFESSEISFENVTELVERFGTIHPVMSLDISGRGPYASVSLSRHDARLYVEASGSGIFFEVGKVLAARQRRWPLLYSFPFIYALLALNFWPTAFNYLFGLEVGYAAAASDVVILGWAIWANFVRFRRHSVIKLTRHIERTSFFQRKKDELALAFVSTIIGVVLGVVGTKLSEKLWPIAYVNAPATSSEKPK